MDATSRFPVLLCLVSLLFGAACGTTDPDPGGPPDAADTPDAVAPPDGGPDVDAGPRPPDLDPADLPDVPAVAALVASAVPHPDMAVVARLDLLTSAVPGITHVRVLSGTTTAYGRSTPWVPIATGRAPVRFPVLDLDPGADNHLQVFAAAGATVVARSGDLVVTTPPLPPGFPLPEVTANDGTADGWLMYPNLSTDFQSDVIGWYVVADHRGRIAWYRPIRQRCDKGMDIRMTSEGNFLMYQYDLEAVEEVDLDGNTVRLWRAPAGDGGLGTDGHDFAHLGDGCVAIIGHDSFRYDLSRVRPSRPPGESVVIGSTLTILGHDSATRRHWAASSAFTPADTLFFLPADWEDGTEFDHMNSFALDTEDRALVSLVALGTVAKVDLVTGQVLWRLGGKSPDMAVVGDPLGGINGVHGILRLDNGNLLAFDNGASHDPPVSRAVEYRIDEAARTATLAWEYRDGTFVGQVSGGVWRRRNGNTIVSWGLSGRVDEVTPDGRLAWSMQVGPTSRANSTWSLYRMPRVP